MSRKEKIVYKLVSNWDGVSGTSSCILKGRYCLKYTIGKRTTAVRCSTGIVCEKELSGFNNTAYLIEDKAVILKCKTTSEIIPVRRELWVAYRNLFGFTKTVKLDKLLAEGIIGSMLYDSHPTVRSLIPIEVVCDYVKDKEEYV